MTTTAPARAESDVPHATRSGRPRWRNPRLVLAVLLVAGSVVLGSRLLATADDTVGVWAVARDLSAGDTFDRADVERRQIRFPDSSTADSYLGADDELPAAATVNREVSSGELLPRSALTTGSRGDLVEVPVSVASDDVPATVRQGSVVDVWVAPKAAAMAKPRLSAEPVLTDVSVVAVPSTSAGLGPQVTRQIIVGVPAARSGDLGAALGAMSEGRVVIARKG